MSLIAQTEASRGVAQANHGYGFVGIAIEKQSERVQAT